MSYFDHKKRYYGYSSKRSNEGSIWVWFNYKTSYGNCLKINKGKIISDGFGKSVHYRAMKKILEIARYHDNHPEVKGVIQWNNM